MNLSKLFEMQKALDARIIKEKGLEGQDLMPNTVLALQVELGELANEWRGFKHWSSRQEPSYGLNAVIKCDSCGGRGYWYTGNRVDCKKCGQTGKIISPLLEEFVDSLHFILSIGRQLEIDIENYENDDLSKEFVSITKAFNHCFNWIVNVSFMEEKGSPYGIEKSYFRLFDAFLSLGKMLGFTAEQIEQGYLDKNAVNHARQENGY